MSLAIGVRTLCIMALAMLMSFAQASAQQKVSFRLDFRLSGPHIPFYWAAEKGYYKDEGLDVTIKEGAGSQQTINLINGKEDDIGLADFYILANAASRGMPVKAVFGLVQTNPWAITTYADSGIKTPKDLEGRSIAALPDHRPLLELFLRRNGVSPEKMTIRSVNVAVRATLFAENKVDSLVSQILGTPMDLVARAQEGKGKPVSFLRFTDYSVASLGPGVFVAESFLQSNPEIVRKFNRATARAVAETAKPENFAEAIEISMKRTGTSEERRRSLALQWEETAKTLRSPNTVGKPYGWMSEEDWKQTLGVLKETQNLATVAKPSDVFSNEFLK
jgi:NitT/TauT family transport system substrate-binding protein